MVVTHPAAFWRAEDGASAIEFALILPILVTMLLSTADFALAINQRMTMQHILRVGAQTAMAGGSQSEVERRLEDARDEYASGRMSELRVATPEIDWRCGTESVDRRDTCRRGREPSSIFMFAADMPYRSIFLGDRLNVDLAVELEVEVPLSWDINSGGGNTGGGGNNDDDNGNSCSWCWWL